MTSSTSKDVSHIVKFNGTNFPSWKFGIWMFLEKHKLVAVVNGTETKPAEVKTFISLTFSNVKQRRSPLYSHFHTLTFESDKPCDLRPTHIDLNFFLSGKHMVPSQFQRSFPSPLKVKRVLITCLNIILCFVLVLKST